MMSQTRSSFLFVPARNINPIHTRAVAIRQVQSEGSQALYCIADLDQAVPLGEITYLPDVLPHPVGISQTYQMSKEACGTLV